MTIKREIQKLDATGKPFGRLASEIATILQGKHRPDFVPHNDMGDFVEVENVEKAKITGNKLTDKIYYRHSGHPGGLKEEKLRDVLAKDPTEALRRAVLRMLPSNKLRKGRMKRLSIK